MKILKRYHKWRIDKAQKEVVELMKSEGYSDKVLEKQAAINKKRAKHNIVDETKIINDKYVQ